MDKAIGASSLYAEQTPLAVLYSVIAWFAGKRKNNEIDARILSREPFDKKGRSPYQRAMEDMTWRTRELIQKDPVTLSPALFLEPSLAATRLLGYLKTQGFGNEELIATLTSDGCGAMCVSLKQHKLDYHLFRNLIDDIARALQSDSSECVAALMTAFTATAFLGNPRKAVENIYIRERLAGSRNVAGTCNYLEALQGHPAPVRECRVGIVRCYEDGSQSEEIHFLDPGERGTVIGRSAPSEGDVTDVDPTVSREHLLLHQNDGRWMARGLGSTNGSKIMRKDGSVEVIESPLSSEEHVSAELELYPGDKLFLGLGTMYKIVLVSF